MKIWTVAIGRVEQDTGDGQEPHAREIQYVSRLCDAKTFCSLATLPLRGVGTEQAGVMCAENDLIRGADHETRLDRDGMERSGERLPRVRPETVLPNGSRLRQSQRG